MSFRVRIEHGDWTYSQFKFSSAKACAAFLRDWERLGGRVNHPLPGTFYIVGGADGMKAFPYQPGMKEY